MISGKWGDCDFSSCSGGSESAPAPPLPPPRGPPPPPPPREQQFAPAPPRGPPPARGQAPPRFIPPPRGGGDQGFSPQVLPPPSRPRSQNPPRLQDLAANNNFLGLLANQMGFLPGGGGRPGPPFARPPVGEDLQLPEPPKLEDLK